MEVVDKGKVPRVGCVDLVVCGHLHPFLKVGKNRNSLDWSQSTTYTDGLLASKVGCPPPPRSPRPGPWGFIFGVFQPDASLTRGTGGGCLDFVDLPFVESLSRVQSFALLLGIVVEGDPKGRRLDISQFIPSWDDHIPA